MGKNYSEKKSIDTTYLNQARRIVLNRLKGYNVDVYLFGSHARGDHHCTSDIDIAIMPLEPLRQGLLSEMREDLEESNIPQLVDIIDLSKAPREFTRTVIREGISWSD
jgi:predicted nucleotidyltransferase